jgi:hypothetical protein
MVLLRSGLIGMAGDPVTHRAGQWLAGGPLPSCFQGSRHMLPPQTRHREALPRVTVTPIDCCRSGAHGILLQDHQIARAVTRAAAQEQAISQISPRPAKAPIRRVG